MANVETGKGKEVTFISTAEKYVDTRVRLDDKNFVVDPKFNTRRLENYAGEVWDKRRAEEMGPAKAGGSVEELAKLIKQDGLMNKPIARDLGNGKIFLVAGFRRVQAVRSLGWEEMDIRVKQMSDAEAIRVNLEENQARKELTTYELAAGCKRYSDALEADGVARKGGKLAGGDAAAWSSKIASEMAISKSAVTMYLRIMDGVHPRILEAWGGNGPEAKLCKLQSLEAWAKMPKEEQLKRFKNLVAVGNEDGTPEGEGAAEGSGSGGNGNKGPAGPKMVKYEFAAEALAFFREEMKDGKTPEARQWAAGVVKGLEWAMGKVKQERNGKMVVGKLGEFDPYAGEEPEGPSTEEKAKARAEKVTKDAEERAAKILADAKAKAEAIAKGEKPAPKVAAGATGPNGPVGNSASVPPGVRTQTHKV